MKNRGEKGTRLRLAAMSYFRIVVGAPAWTTVGSRAQQASKLENGHFSRDASGTVAGMRAAITALRICGMLGGRACNQKMNAPRPRAVREPPFLLGMLTIARISCFSTNAYAPSFNP